jgi:hypothetical protein
MKPGSEKVIGPVCAALALVLCVSSLPATADDVDEPAEDQPERRGMAETIFLGVGAFNVHFDTTARKSSPALGQNPRIDFEDLLGLDEDRLEARLNGFWRIAPRHRLSFGYMLLGRNAATTIIDLEFEWDDTTWPVGAEVTSLLDTEVLELGYNYSFVRKPRREWGLAVGLSMFQLEYYLAGEGFVTLPDGSRQEGFFVEEDSLWAPVPSLGVHLGYSIAPKWFMRSSATLFGYSSDSWKARYIDARALFEFYPWRNVGFGAGLSLIELLYIDKGEDELRVDYGFGGGTFYVGIVF